MKRPNASVCSWLRGIAGERLDVAGASLEAGARIIQWSCEAGTIRHWTVEASTDRKLSRRGETRRHALDVSGASTADAAAVIRFRRTIATSRKWTIDPMGG